MNEISLNYSHGKEGACHGKRPYAQILICLLTMCLGNLFFLTFGCKLLNFWPWKPSVRLEFDLAVHYVSRMSVFSLKN